MTEIIKCLFAGKTAASAKKDTEALNSARVALRVRVEQLLRHSAEKAA